MNKDLYLNIDINKEMANGHIKYLEPYLDAVKRRTEEKYFPVLEVGIGTGICSMYLETVGYPNVFGVDIEPDIVKRFDTETRFKFGSEVQVQVADAFDLSKINEELQDFIVCIHHQGLLEHFSEEETIKMLDYHTGLVKGYVIFAVPIEGYIEKNVTYDEHEDHWSLNKWLVFLKRYDLFEYGVFGVDCDNHQAYFVIKKWEN